MQRIGSARPPSDPTPPPKAGSQLVTKKAGSQLVTKSGSQLAKAPVKAGSQLKAAPKKVSRFLSEQHL